MGFGRALSIALTMSSAGFSAMQGARRGGDGAAAHHADRVRLRQQVAHRSRLQPNRPARPPPGHRARRLGGIHACARREVGEHVEEQPPVQRRRGGEQRIRKRCIGFTVRTAMADQARPARKVQPRRRQQVPLVGRRGFDEPVRGHRGRPVRARAVLRVRFRHARRDQARRRGNLENQREPALVDAGHLRQPFDVANPEPAAAELGNRCGAEGFEQQLDLAQ